MTDKNIIIHNAPLSSHKREFSENGFKLSKSDVSFLFATLPFLQSLSKKEMKTQMLEVGKAQGLLHTSQDF